MIRLVAVEVEVEARASSLSPFLVFPLGVIRLHFRPIRAALATSKTPSATFVSLIFLVSSTCSPSHSSVSSSDSPDITSCSVAAPRAPPPDAQLTSASHARRADR